MSRRSRREWERIRKWEPYELLQAKLESAQAHNRHLAEVIAQLREERENDKAGIPPH